MIVKLKGKKRKILFETIIATTLEKEVAKNDELLNISDKGLVMKANYDVDNGRVL